MDQKITCHECGTENEPQYEYCKNCGTPLKNQEDKKSSDKSGYNQNYNYDYTGQYAKNSKQNFYNTYSIGGVVESIDGVPTDDVIAYVGKKSYNIIPKFSKMELIGSKASWCWPVAVLSYLFGPLGAAIWFFYRKMYKIAFILVAIGLAVGVALSFVSGPSPVYDDTYSGIIENSLAEGNYSNILGTFGDLLSSPENVRIYISTAINTLIQILTMVFSGIYSYYFYKRSVISGINNYRLTNVDPRYYKMGLASLGGTSPGMAVLGVVIMIFANQIFDLVTVLL